jgi:hypothetical protein
MNDPQWVEAARKLAERSLAASPDAGRRLDFLARVTLGRPLEAREAAVLAAAEKKYEAHFAASPDDARALLAVGESKPDAAFDPREVAEWTMVSSQFLNLDEFLTK